MDVYGILKIAGVTLPLVVAGGFVFASVRWRLPSLVKRVDALEGGGFIKRTELYDENGETRYLPVSRCDKSMAQCQELIHKEIRLIGASISNLNEGHELMRKGLAKVDKQTALMAQRLDDFIKYHSKD